MALIIEADKTANINMEDTNKKMVQMPMETILTIHSNLKEPTQHGEQGNKVEHSETVPIRNGCISVLLYQLTLPALVDTDASVCCIGEKLFQSLGAFLT